jgi:hypothetical protein
MYILNESLNFFQESFLKDFGKNMLSSNKKNHPQQEYIGEEDLSAKQHSQKKNSRFLTAHVHKRWAFSFAAQEGQRPEEIGG